jgi:L-lactate permease
VTLLDRLLGLSGLTPHGFCLLWNPGLLWLHAGSDAVTALAYFSIPVCLVRLVRGRDDIKPGWIVLLFAGFIMACGATHVMSILTLWIPAYTAEGVVKLITAALSLTTAAVLWPLVPAMLALPAHTDLERLNRALQARIATQEYVTAELREKKMRLLLAQEAGHVGS